MTLLSIFIRSLSFILMMAFVLPKAYREARIADKELGDIPYYLLFLWVVAATFMLSSIFFVYLGFQKLGVFDSVLMLIGSIIVTLMYRNYNISEQVRKKILKK